MRSLLWETTPRPVSQPVLGAEPADGGVEGRFGVAVVDVRHRPLAVPQKPEASLCTSGYA